MLFSYVRTAVRNLARSAGYALLNVVGLAVGLACCILILTYVARERSFDEFHEKADRIDRAYTKTSFGESPSFSPSTAAPFGDYLLSTHSEVEAVSRVLPDVGESLVTYGDRSNYEDGIGAADPSFFEIFDFELMAGDPQTALATPYTVVLTPEFAVRYFGDRDPVGEVMQMEFWGWSTDFTVTGVVESPPANSHLQFEALMSYATYLQYQIDTNGNDISGSWNMTNPATYVLRRPGTDWREFDARVTEGVARHVVGSIDGFESTDDLWFEYHLQPLTDIHLGELGLPIEADADVRTLNVFTFIALLVLAIACINYMNLATARAGRRAREIGVRKSFGARRMQLAGQFLTEAVLLSLLAAVVAAVIIEAALPFFADLTAGALSDVSWSDGRLMAGLAGVALAAGILAGSYPALILSGFSPISSLRGSRTTQTGGSVLRKVLVVAQFAGGIALVVATLVVMRQMDYIRDRNLGYDSEQVVTVPMRSNAVEEQAELVKERLAAVPGVRSAALASQLPEKITGGNGIMLVGAPEGSGMIRRVLAADEDFAEVLDLNLIAGRWFIQGRPTDEKAFVLNESAVRALELDEPLGAEINRNGNVGPVIGVVEDFHIESLHKQIAPLFIYAPRASYHHRYLVLKLEAGDLQQTISRLGESWASLLPGVPFSYDFLDDRLDRLYEAEIRQGRLFGIFAALGIFVACLGLFGLAAYTAQQRTKEIGIRKVLGATVSSIMMLLSREFLVLVGFAFVVAAPVAWILMDRWLDDFAYHVDPDTGSLLLAAAVSLGIALLTVSGQAFRAAMSDPVDSLRAE